MSKFLVHVSVICAHSSLVRKPVMAKQSLLLEISRSQGSPSKRQSSNPPSTVRPRTESLARGSAQQKRPLSTANLTQSVLQPPMAPITSLSCLMIPTLVLFLLTTTRRFLTPPTTVHGRDLCPLCFLFPV